MPLRLSCPARPCFLTGQPTADQTLAPAASLRRVSCDCRITRFGEAGPSSGAQASQLTSSTQQWNSWVRPRLPSACCVLLAAGLPLLAHGLIQAGSGWLLSFRLAQACLLALFERPLGPSPAQPRQRPSTCRAQRTPTSAHTQHGCLLACLLLVCHCLLTVGSCCHFQHPSPQPRNFTIGLACAGHVRLLQARPCGSCILSAQQRSLAKPFPFPPSSGFSV